MKYYVIAEDELKEFKMAVAYCAYAELGQYNAACDELLRCYTKCRARPVRFIGAHAEGSSLMLWGEEE